MLGDVEFLHINGAEFSNKQRRRSVYRWGHHVKVEPWVAIGMSRRTYYRRKADGKLRAVGDVRPPYMASVPSPVELGRAAVEWFGPVASDEPTPNQMI